MLLTTLITMHFSTFQLLILFCFSCNMCTAVTSRYGTGFLRGVVMEVDLTSDPKRLIITSTNLLLEDVNLTIQTRAVILATGSKSRWLGVRVGLRDDGCGWIVGCACIGEEVASSFVFLRVIA